MMKARWNYAIQSITSSICRHLLKMGFRDRMDYIKGKNGWFAPASEILDRLLDIKKIIMVEDDERIVIVNSGVKDIRGFTVGRIGTKMLWNPGGAAVTWQPDGKIILDRFAAGSSLTFYKTPPFRWEGKAVASGVTRWERLRIEFSNYIVVLLKKI